MVTPGGGSYVGFMGTAEVARARDRLLRVGDGADMAEVLRETIAALHVVTRFSWATVMTVDPRTLLPTGAIVEGFAPSDCVPFWENELLKPGFNTFVDLARRRDPVATLWDATDGDLTRSAMYTDMYAPIGVADELRAAFVSGTTCWGVAVLVRAEADGTFGDADQAAVRDLAPVIAHQLRNTTRSLATAAVGSAAMIVVDADDRIADLTTDARRLLAELATPGLDEDGLPILLKAIVTRARNRGSASQLATRVTGTTGRWLRVTAAPMADDPRRVAVMVEPAHPSDIMPILLETYGLTDRQVEIVLLLARGLSSKDIAAEVGLSAHTVRDHLKAIFDKADVNSRGELLARLFSEHIVDRFHAATHRAP